MTTGSNVVFWSGFAIIALGAVGGMFPLWKSATLSPDSIQRRVYWTGCGVGVLVLFVAQLPDLKRSIILALAILLGLVAVAFNWTTHIRIGGRTYSAFESFRRADRPPALQPNDTVD